jgi:hypothetical protein
MPLKKVWDNLAGNWDLHPRAFRQKAVTPSENVTRIPE